MVLLTLFLSFLTPAAAAPAAPAESGYVVKVESGTVYLDFGKASGAAAGQRFHVFTEGEELLHPITGASLGRAQVPVAEGLVGNIEDMFSVGRLDAGGKPVERGMRARLGVAPPPPAAPAPPTPAQIMISSKDGVPMKAPRWRSPAFEMKVHGMAVAEFEGPGKLGTALADEKHVGLFAYPPSQIKPLASFKHPGVAPRIVSLESGDLNGNGRAELFVSLYNETFTRFETLVLEYEDGAFKTLADIPYLVRGHDDGAGNKVLAMQQLHEDSTFPFGAIYPLVYEDGKYKTGKSAIRIKRVDFLYDFTKVDLDGSGSPAVLYLTSNDVIRAQFKTGTWKGKDSFGQSPIRVRWHGKLLEFRPNFAVNYGPDKKPAIYAVRNISVLGSLSEPFGLFNNAEIHRKSWDGVALKADWKAELGGYSTAIAIAKNELAVAVTGSSGRSSVWIYDP